MVRLVDSTGQTLQYSLPRPLASLDPEAWYSETVDLNTPSLSYGGAADKVPHPPFKRLDILLEVLKFRNVASPFNPHRLDFDDVTFLATRGESLDPAAVPTPFAGTQSLGDLGVNIHFNRNDSALDALKGSGLTWLRMDLGWSGIERTKGVYDFSAQDALVAAAAARGLQVHFILDFANPLYGNGPPVSAEALAGFKAFSQAAAAHFRGKAEHFEVWNEPDLPGFWDPVDTLAYAAACAAAIAGVHAGNAGALVSTGGVSEVDWPFVSKLLAEGGGVGADAVGVHPYRNGIPEGLVDEILLLRAVTRAAYGASAPPLWDTEWGYTATDFGGRTAEAYALQARYALRRILASWSVGFPFLIQYDLIDDGDDPANREHNFGLLARDLSDKPAMAAVRALAAHTRGFAAKGFLPTRESDVHALKLESASGILIVLWRASAGEYGVVEARDTMTVAFGTRPAGAWDMLGKPLALPPESGGKTVFAAGPDPVYLVFAKAGTAVRSPVSRKVTQLPSLRIGDSHGGAYDLGLGAKVWASELGETDPIWRDLAGRRAHQ